MLSYLIHILFSSKCLGEKDLSAGLGYHHWFKLNLLSGGRGKLISVLYLYEVHTLSNRFLKLFKEGAVTTLSGNSFQVSTTLRLKGMSSFCPAVYFL